MSWAADSTESVDIGSKDELTSLDQVAIEDGYGSNDHGPYDSQEDLIVYAEKPKTVVRYVNSFETVFAANIMGCELDMASFKYGDALECFESTLKNAYAEIILGDSVFIIENKYLSEEQPESIEIIKDAGMFTLTAYAWSGHHCANGKYPRVKHTVAAHKKQFPLGTKLYIEGYGIFYVDDRGGFPMGTIDVYMGDKMKCKQFGRRKAHVYVLAWGDGMRYPAEKVHPSKSEKGVE